MKRTFRVSLVLSIVATLLTPVSATAVSANPTPDCSAGSTCTITFTYTGDFYSWTVPSGVSSINLDLYGAQGGSGSSAGGRGGRITGTLAVTAGSIIYIYVGGQNGYNGGGTAGTGGGSATFSASTGGGATDIRVGGQTYNDRLAVAGGGGGAGRQSCTSQAGGGGGYPGGIGGAGDGTKLGGDGTATAGGSVNGSNSGGASLCSSSPHGGGGGGQNGGGAAGGYVVSAGGANGACGSATTDNSAGQNPGRSGGCFGTGGNGGNNTNNGGGGGGGGWYGGGAGGSNWASGGGGGSSYLGSMTSTSFVNATRNGNGTASITYLNSPTPTTFSTSQSSPTNISTGTTVSYSLVISQSVTDLATSDFQFGGTSSCNTPGLSGSGTTYTVTVTNCSEGTLILQLKANSITGTSTGPPSVSSANTVIIDRTAPTISSVTAPANRTYIPSETPTFTVAFSESVTVIGTPRLTLTVGSTTEYANFLSMSDSKTALFRYTVASDPAEFDTDGIAISTTLDLNSGTIRDLATNAIVDRTFSAPTLTSVLVAQPAAAPTIDSITATSGTLTVYFTPGAARGSTTSNYQFSTNNGGSWSTRSPVATTSPLTITGLTNGQGYQVRLRAITNAGTSDSSTVVNETPTAVAVTGDSTLTLTYGNSASTSSYSATGGTGSYTWSLGSVISGVTLSGTTVTAANTLAAGTYSQTVRATDGNSQVGTRSLTITVNKASTSISIALPNSATSAALGGAITITATVSRAGSVNFQLGGSTISGCGSASAATTTATCSWTPASLGSVSLTAVFTPTDSSNFETSTTTTLAITVVNGVSTVTLSLTGGLTQVPKGQAINIIAAIDQAGRVTFLVDGKRVPGCINRLASIGNISCSWRPAVQKPVMITANLNPTNNVYNNSTSRLAVQVTRRTGAR